MTDQSIPLTGTVLLMDDQLSQAASALLQTIAAINCARHSLRTGSVEDALVSGRRVIEHFSTAQRALITVAGLTPKRGGLVH